MYSLIRRPVNGDGHKFLTRRSLRPVTKAAVYFSSLASENTAVIRENAGRILDTPPSHSVVVRRCSYCLIPAKHGQHNLYGLDRRIEVRVRAIATVLSAASLDCLARGELRFTISTAQSARTAKNCVHLRTVLRIHQLDS